MQGGFVSLQSNQPKEERTVRATEALFDTTDFEERAAILEFDGGMPRAEAEIQAKREIEERK